MRPSCSSNAARSDCDARRPSRTLLAQLVERAQAGVERRLGGDDRLAEAPSRRDAVALQILARASRRASRARAPPLRAAAPRRASALARSTSAGVRRLGFGGRAPPAPASPRARRTAGAARRFSCSSAVALLGLDARDRLPRLFLPRILRRAAPLRPMRRSVAICSCFRRMRSDASARRRHLQVEADDRPSPAGAARPAATAIADSAAAIDTSSDAISSRSRSTAARCSSARSRSSLISRLVVRMPRASARAPPSTTCAPRKTSPSSVTIGAEVTAAAPRRLEVAARSRRARSPRGWRPRPGPTRGRRRRAASARRRRRGDGRAASSAALGDDETRRGRHCARARTAGRPPRARAMRTTTCWSRSPRQASTARS